jgi:hypothetical protein
MATFYETFARRQNLGILSTVLGVLGLVLFWWAPAGIVLGFTGLVLGLVGGVRIRREAGSHAWVAAGIILGLAAIGLGIVAAANGWILWQVTSWQ